uniref:AlNc14C197G8581 protein n=1 Tax=Albugo laibachii Nc14 TaxID=890382 RepID=F0WQA0_9STRA|nr:AlNc14C197G8581 [Albugo laibachii Nc14]|eukprot:CCA23508.1 AlNc14C197G8581 [Albugo laibachii Nc14]
MTIEKELARELEEEGTGTKHTSSMKKKMLYPDKKGNIFYRFKATAIILHENCSISLTFLLHHSPSLI